MEVTRVLTIQLNLNKEQSIVLGHLTYSASKLWNVANYKVVNKQVKLNQLKQTLKQDFWYKNLHSQSAQAVLEKLQIAWENCYKKHTKKPRYQPKDGHFPVKWKKQGFVVENNRLRLSLSKQTKTYLKEEYSIESNYLWIDLPKNLSLSRVQEVEIKPHTIYGHTVYVMHIVYKKEITPIKINSNKTMAVDLGITNLATCVAENIKPTIYDGKILISKLRLYSKKKSKLQSAVKLSGYTTSKKLFNLTVKERNYVKDYIHKVSALIVRQAKQNDIGCIVIGAMSDGITSMDIGSKNNEKLHKIPFGRLYSLIRYKAEEIGISVIKVDEAYTSQTCCRCGIVKKSNRKYRGLYVCSSCNTVVNADVNGAVNILKRVTPNLEIDRSRGFLDNPVRIRIS